MSPTLVVLAAGKATRYGSMKQMEAFGPSGETIMEYSIYDAIEAGFSKIVFIVRQETLDLFKNAFENKIGSRAKIEYVIQDNNITIENEHFFREKPWGTAHAMYCVRDCVKEPFCIINADDFYGRDTFQKMYQFLTETCNDSLFGMVGFELQKTLSDNGSVSRGVCEADAAGMLTDIKERTKISKKGSQIVFEENGNEVALKADAIVSMNCWGFSTAVFGIIETMLEDFFKKNKENPTAEIYITSVAEYCTAHKIAAIKVMSSNTQWFGVTYPEDKNYVVSELKTLVEKNIYPISLW